MFIHLFCPLLIGGTESSKVYIHRRMTGSPKHTNTHKEVGVEKLAKENLLALQVTT